MSTASKACLRLCACGKHGRLLGDCGIGGIEFTSKDEALYALAVSQRFETIRPDMLESLRRQIEASDLPNFPGGADPEIVKKVAAFNHLRVAKIEATQNDVYDPERFHEYLSD